MKKEEFQSMYKYLERKSTGNTEIKIKKKINLKEQIKGILHFVGFASQQEKTTRKMKKKLKRRMFPSV
jgi:hypothetical protein